MTTAAIKVQRDIIALETFTLTSANKMLSNFFPSMVANLKEFAERFKAENGAISFSSDQKRFLKKLETLNYLDIANFSVSVPDGFSSNFVDYLKDLSVASTQISAIEKEILNPFSTYLAKLISSADHRFDTSNYFTLLNDYGDKREQNLINLKTHFSAKVGTVSTLSEVVSRNADWSVVFRFDNEIMKELNSVNRTNLDKKVKEISSYLSLITDKIKKNELQGVSPEVTRSLAEGVYQVARDLEAFSIIYYQALVITTSIDQFVGKINQMKE